MRLTCFGSGSNGNAMLIQSCGTNILLDAGVPVRRLQAGLAAAGAGELDLSAILVSHEHHDHISALTRLGRQHACPRFCTEGTLRELAPPDRSLWETLLPEQTFRIGAIEITAIRVAHDAAEPVGFLLDDRETRAAIFTDLGETSEALIEPIRTSQIVVLEANYDEVMLARGPYPAHLKRRIRGPHGHLSNDDCARFLANHLTSTTLDVWLAHLSQNNNRPSLARTAVVSQLSFEGSGLGVRALPRGGVPTSWDSETARRRPRQTSFSLET